MRVSRYPNGQFVLERKNEVLGVLYTQRIQDRELLRESRASRIDRLLSNDGQLVQLLA